MVPGTFGRLDGTTHGVRRPKDQSTVGREQGCTDGYGAGLSCEHARDHSLEPSTRSNPGIDRRVEFYAAFYCCKRCPKERQMPHYFEGSELEVGFCACFSGRRLSRVAYDVSQQAVLSVCEISNTTASRPCCACCTRCASRCACCIWSADIALGYLEKMSKTEFAGRQGRG